MGSQYFLMTIYVIYALNTMNILLNVLLSTVSPVARWDNTWLSTALLSVFS